MLVVAEDRTARRQCSQMDIAIAGTIGIIKASFQDGRITVNQANNILQKITDFGFILRSERLMNSFIKLLGNKKGEGFTLV